LLDELLALELELVLLEELVMSELEHDLFVELFFAELELDLLDELTAMELELVLLDELEIIELEEESSVDISSVLDETESFPHAIRKIKKMANTTFTCFSITCSDSKKRSRKL